MHGAAVEATRRALERIRACEHPAVWITLVEPADALAAAAAVDRRVAAGEQLPLAGRTLAVKDNIDVAGLPTTAACPSYAYRPEVSATAVQRLVDAGAVVLGKANLDQFATGLTGTRSPYGICPNALDPTMLAGGSSSGSAVAVALGLVDLGVATDTAGSGRVPAALHGLFGVKPTVGRVPTDGVVPACASIDCVSIISPDLDLGVLAVAVMAGEAPPTATAGPPPVVGVPAPGRLHELLQPAVAEHFAGATARFDPTVSIDVDLLLEVAALLYGGGFAAERHAAVGAHLAAHPEDADPAVAATILAAGSITGPDVWRDRARLRALAARIAPLWDRVDVLALPTVPGVFTLAEVAADPFGPNSLLGTTNSFCNLLGWCAVTVPAGVLPGSAHPAGVTLFGPGGADAAVAAAAAAFCGPAVNDPAVVAEVRAVFQRYETALVANDLAVLDELFWASPHTQRVGVDDRQHGAAEVSAFRRAQPRQTAPRRLVDLEVLTFGRGGVGSTATVTTTFVPDDPSLPPGRQSQTWLRMPAGWRVVAAHVSLATSSTGPTRPTPPSLRT